MSDRTAPPKDSIGGTTAAQVLGHSKYGNKHAAYRKIASALDGNPVSIPVNFNMHRGLLAEDKIVDMVKEDFESSTGMRIAELFGSGVVRHKDFPFIHATVDRVVFDKSGKIRGIVEVKSCDTTWASFDWERKDYRCQLEHYDCIFKSAYESEISEHGLDHNYLLVATGDEHTWRTFVRMIESGEDPSVLKPIMGVEYRKVDFSGSYKEESLPKLVDFWTKNIEPRVMPDVDETDGCKVNIMEANPERSGGRVVDGSDPEYIQVSTIIEGRARLKAKLKDLSEEERGLKEEIKLMDNHLRFIVGRNKWMESDSFKVTVSKRDGRKKFDKDQFMSDNPGLYEKYQSEGDGYETLKVTLK
jgi:hypothetical protein